MVKVKTRRVSVKVVLVGALLILAVFGMYYLGLIKKSCGTDEACLEKAALECKPSKSGRFINNNYYVYDIKGKRSGSCLIAIKLDRMAAGTPYELKNMFEGKGMECRIPLELGSKTQFYMMDNLVNYCHGELKEAMYEQIIQKMYALIIQNMGDIISDIKGSLYITG